MPISICYHAVSDTLDSPLAVARARLREHMSLLAGRGLSGVSFRELERRRDAGEDVAKLVGITFDDGYESTLVARDVLDEFGFTASVYVLPNRIGSGEPLRWEGIEQWSDGPLREELVPMTWDGVESLRESGWEIGAHTYTHPNLTKISDDQLAQELEGPRRDLVERLGECHSVAYPYGYADRRVADAAAAAGYTHAGTLTGWFIHDEPFLRPRIGIYRHDTAARYRVKCSRAMTALRSVPLLLRRSS